VEARPGEPGDAAAVGTGEAGEGNAALVISPEAYALVTTALELRGTPYVNGGSDPFGFDCSGFTQWVFAQNHVALPREVKDQYRIGDKVKVDELTAGDLLFFATTSRDASHVGIALGPDEFIHAPSSNGVVRVERLSTKYWAERDLGARRIGLR
jgi:cell wall-associated NlpC family hydrolase